MAGWESVTEADTDGDADVEADDEEERVCVPLGVAVNDGDGVIVDDCVRDTDGDADCDGVSPADAVDVEVTDGEGTCNRIWSAYSGSVRAACAPVARPPATE